MSSAIHSSIHHLDLRDRHVVEAAELAYLGAVDDLAVTFALSIVAATAADA
jgi:hypothetical protein